MKLHLVALALLLLVPLAAADHVFSHRVYVVGRVLDPEGQPAAGVVLNLTFVGLAAPTGCFDNKPEMTGPRGDYTICRHAHALPDNASVIVRAGNVSGRAIVDPELRHAVVDLQLNTTSAHDLSGQRQFARTYTVAGRAFALLDKPTNAEGVFVNATPLTGNITADLRVLDRILATTTVAPDEHGNFQADLAVEEIPRAAIVRVRIGQDLNEEPALQADRRSDLNLVRDLRLLHGPGSDAPGSSATPLGALVVVGALAFAGVATRRAR